MADMVQDVIVHDASGVPTATPPTFTYYDVFDAGGLVAPQPADPAFAPVAGETGRYTFTVTLLSGQYVRFQINKGADPEPYEYGFLRYTDLVSTESLLAELTAIRAKTDALPAAPASEATAEAGRVAALLARKVLTNKIAWNASTAIMTIYDDDGTTVLYTFAFTDANGAASVLNPLNRTPA